MCLTTKKDEDVYMCVCCVGVLRDVCGACVACVLANIDTVIYELYLLMVFMNVLMLKMYTCVLRDSCGACVACVLCALQCANNVGGCVRRRSLKHLIRRATWPQAVLKNRTSQSS